MKKNKKIAIFEGQKIRRIWDDGKELWYFSVVDVIEILTGSTIPKRYWSDLKIKLVKEGSQVYEKIVQLKFLANDGKYYLSDAADTEVLFRLIQTIPSPKAEPFKRWLAKVGYERIQEIENPELATKRTVAIYKAKGYPEDWIDKRMRGIAVRQTLTNEWQNRGIREKIEYEILTTEISKAAFGMTPSEYKKLKGLERENLRDHMDDMELILTMLGEATTTRFTKDRNSAGFHPLKKDARDGGAVAGRTRKDIEKQSGKKIVSKNNFLPKRKAIKI